MESKCSKDETGKEKGLLMRAARNVAGHGSVTAKGAAEMGAWEIHTASGEVASDNRN